MLLIRAILMFLLLSTSCLSGAQSPPESKPRHSIILEHDAQHRLRLSAREATLRQVFDAISEKTGATIHTLALPDALLTVDCQGSLKSLLQCLLGSHVDRVFRNGSAENDYQTKDAQSEVWLLQMPVISSVHPVSDDDPALALKPPQRVAATDSEIAEITDQLLELARDPRERMNAIISLARAGREGDAQVQRVLKNALSDKDPGVRAQAVFELAQREGQAALPEIEAALQDVNAEVRRMAVESVGNNMALLQQALKDSDENIRQYATTKLQLLNKVQTD